MSLFFNSLHSGLWIFFVSQIIIDRIKIRNITFIWSKKCLVVNWLSHIQFNFKYSNSSRKAVDCYQLSPKNIQHIHWKVGNISPIYPNWILSTSINSTNIWYHIYSYEHFLMICNSIFRNEIIENTELEIENNDTIFGAAWMWIKPTDAIFMNLIRFSKYDSYYFLNNSNICCIHMNIYCPFTLFISVMKITV